MFPEGKSDIYSDPVEQKIGKKAVTLDRKRPGMGANLLSPDFLSPEHTAGGFIDLDHTGEELSDYASVEDALKHTELSAGMVQSLRRQARHTPSMSPPPFPLSPPSSSSFKAMPITATTGPGTVGQEKEEFVDMYASVDISHNTNGRVTSPTGKERGYDHLNADDSPPMSGYDKLNPPARPPRTDLNKSHGSPSSSGGGYDPLEKTLVGGRACKVSPPSSEEYATIGNNGRTERGDERKEELPMYATIDTCKRTRPRPQPHAVVTGGVADQSTQGTGNLYSAVNKSHSMRSPPPHVPVPVPRTTVQQPEDMYSVPNKVKRRENGRDGGRGKRSSGHFRMQSEDHILHSVVTDNQMYSTVQKPPPPKPKPRRAVTPESALYSVPDRKTDKKARPSPPVQHPSPTMQPKYVLTQTYPPVRSLSPTTSPRE